MSRYQFTKAYGQWGADMGRPTRLPVSQDVTLRLERVRLDSGGYDPGGAYWGHSQRLYVAWIPGTEVQLFVRADDRAGAKAEVLHSIRNGRFYR